MQGSKVRHTHTHYTHTHTHTLLAHNKKKKEIMGIITT
jgi:hypothetical protein